MADEPTTGREAIMPAARDAGLTELVPVNEWTCPDHEFGPHECDCELCTGCPTCKTARWRQARGENGELLFRERTLLEGALREHMIGHARLIFASAADGLLLGELERDDDGGVRIPIIRAAEHDTPAP